MAVRSLRTAELSGRRADWLVGQHVFLRESDMQNDRLIGLSGARWRPIGRCRISSHTN